MAKKINYPLTGSYTALDPCLQIPLVSVELAHAEEEQYVTLNLLNMAPDLSRCFSLLHGVTCKNTTQDL